MNQKDYLTAVERTCKVNKPIFVNRNVQTWLKTHNQYWDVANADLVWANQVTQENIVGRQRLTLNNSSVQEFFLDIESNINPATRADVNNHYLGLRNATLRAISILHRWNITDDYIYIKSSGKGFHVSVFFDGLTAEQFNDTVLMLLYCMNLPNSKSSEAPKTQWIFGLDLAVTLREGKIRDFGGQNEKLGEMHYCSRVTLPELLHNENYPFVNEAAKVVYPNIKVYVPTEDFKTKAAMYSMRVPKQASNVERSNPIEYNKPGNPEQLTQCPLIRALELKAQTQHHLLHQERIFLSQLYPFFGERGERLMHEILRNCSDYDAPYTQMQIEWVKRHNRKPITCDWAKTRIGCPQCSGSGGKSPIKFAYRRHF